jgi:transcriptional regulator with XRE-family HTH domain
MQRGQPGNKPRDFDTRPDFAQTVHIRRVSLGLTQSALAERARLTQPEVSNLETGKLTLGPVRMTRLMDALRADGPLGRGVSR